uniref:Uncharacterized protein n=1 Tax=Sipha flava TaxID=143950 RepID=A0A2S2RAL9_9HEMI
MYMYGCPFPLKLFPGSPLPALIDVVVCRRRYPREPVTSRGRYFQDVRILLMPARPSLANPPPTLGPSLWTTVELLNRFRFSPFIFSPTPVRIKSGAFACAIARAP